ncbi:hypothetical protein E2C01_081605 [Portunus trituberculatus]|uniref:Uncharacterized protein n=1 Tax=Portunus trituberculatus TaxID=210409 RepID=A0A5B7IX16_PORTR|nr:hypothetical protein [Portunus trituberculatus]
MLRYAILCKSKTAALSSPLGSDAPVPTPTHPTHAPKPTPNQPLLQDPRVVGYVLSLVVKGRGSLNSLSPRRHPDACNATQGGQTFSKIPSKLLTFPEFLPSLMELHPHLSPTF